MEIDGGSPRGHAANQYIDATDTWRQWSSMTCLITESCGRLSHVFSGPLVNPYQRTLDTYGPTGFDIH